MFTPDGKKLGEVDGVHLLDGSETVSGIAEATGIYLIEVRSSEKTAKTGRYEVKVEELRAANTEDKYRVAGETIFREAKQLKDGTLDAKRKSIEKYYEALELYRRATYRNGKAQTLKISAGYWALGETRKALEKYNESRPLSRAVGDRSGEANTLNNIGKTDQSMGEPQKALEKFNEALPILRALGDHRGEGVMIINIGRVYQEMGEKQKALEKYNEALPICER